jgi:hypothetical protein
MKRLLRSMLGLLVLAMLMLAPGGKHRILYKSSRSALRIKTASGYLDTFLDCVLSERDDFLKMEEVNTEGFSLQASRKIVKSKADPVAVNLLAYLLSYVSGANLFREFTVRITGDIREACGLNLDAKALARIAARVYWQEKLYLVILRRLSPRVVVLTDTGDYGLRLAAIRTGIKVVEMQHGVFDDDHPDAVPRWVVGSSYRNIEPDFLICRGEFSKERLRNSRLFPTRLLALGYEPIDRARAARASLGTSANRYPEVRILVSSQGYEREALSAWVLDFIDKTPPTLQLKIFLKLHPFYDIDESAFKELRRDGHIELIAGADERSIYDLLVGTDVHMSISSNAHYDAASLGVPSLVIPLKGFELVANFADEKAIYVASSPADAWDRILDSDTYRRARSASNFYCETKFSESVTKMLREWV